MAWRPLYDADPIHWRIYAELGVGWGGWGWGGVGGGGVGGWGGGGGGGGGVGGWGGGGGGGGGGWGWGGGGGGGVVDISLQNTIILNVIIWVKLSFCTIVKYTKLTNPIIHLYNIPQYTI